MVARGAGDVGCAHCTLIGADRACQVCTRMVCERCASDWATCSEPSGRVVRLGLTARLRDVDPTGRLGFVTHWRQAPRLFDLRQLRWVRGVRFSRGSYLWNRAHPPRLTGNGRLISGDWNVGNETRPFNGMRIMSLRMNTEFLIESECPTHGTAVSAVGDYFYYVTARQRVAIIRGSGSYSVEPLPYKVVQAAHVDGERDLLAAASWSEVVLHRIVGGKLEQLGHRKTHTIGNVHAVAVAGSWLVIVVRTDGEGTLAEVRRLERDLSIGPVEYRYPLAAPIAELSRDGRYLAFVASEGLRVHELGTENVSVFTEHTDQINLVRFAAEDHLLISADTDNRVVMRPRTASGYASPLLAIEVPEEGVELPSFESAAR